MCFGGQNMSVLKKYDGNVWQVFEYGTEFILPKWQGLDLGEPKDMYPKMNWKIYFQDTKKALLKNKSEMYVGRGICVQLRTQAAQIRILIGQKVSNPYPNPHKKPLQKPTGMMQ